MASWQSKFMTFTFRNKHFMQGQWKVKTWDMNTSIPALRKVTEKGAEMIKMPKGIEAVPVKIDGLPAGLAAEWLQPVAGGPVPLRKDAVIFYTHGGGYVSGTCSDHRAIVAKFVAGSGIRLLLFEYRLAPEQPFPAAMDDTLTAYRWLLGQITPSTQIIIAGESAGGGLCFSAMLAMRETGLPLPVAGISLSPWTDLKLTGESHVTRLKASIDPPEMTRVCAKHYFGDNDPENPWISPLYGDLHGLPPLLIIVGNDETLRDDSIMFSEKAKAAGVDVTLRVVEGQTHCFPLLPDFIPESHQAMNEINAFMRAHLAEKTSQPVPASISLP